MGTFDNVRNELTSHSKTLKQQKERNQTQQKTLNTEPETKLKTNIKHKMNKTTSKKAK